ncbi:uncharacterized protein LOC26526272 [Drosophila erecta]|uniref:uncharacterized protein LOC26526272 n=1 Tax=Drosophila erecta TaxID=7220 RepID=UPI000732BA8E|nr:uncharacterized protein LOC26526272 [Drosophila erecta]KQS51985.1 uncharacterized protein Dere_GG26448 [Drosophila erecta]
MGAKEMFLILSVLIIYSVLETKSLFEFTNINCSSIDMKVGEYEYCYLKSINRSYKYASGKFKLHQTPLTHMKINCMLWKRFNGYKPFLYNITFEFCKFLKNKKTNQVIKFLFDSFSSYSNLNHSCPYSGDLYVDKLPIGFLNHRVTEILPVPEGKYMLEFHFFTLNSNFARLQVHFIIS